MTSQDLQNMARVVNMRLDAATNGKVLKAARRFPPPTDTAAAEAGYSDSDSDDEVEWRAKSPNQSARPGKKKESEVEYSARRLLQEHGCKHGCGFSGQYATVEQHELACRAENTVSPRTPRQPTSHLLWRLDRNIAGERFGVAMRLAAEIAPERLPSVQLEFAMYLEDTWKFKEAQKWFLRAGQPQHAVDMYMHEKNYVQAFAVSKEVLLAAASPSSEGLSPSSISLVVEKLAAQHPDNIALRCFDPGYFKSLGKQDRAQLLQCIITPSVSAVPTVEAVVNCGCVAFRNSDYDKFEPFFSKVIEAVRTAKGTTVFDQNEKLPKLDSSQLEVLKTVPLRLTHKAIRNLAIFPMPFLMTKEQRCAQEEVLRQGILRLQLTESSLGGKYTSLTPGHPDSTAEDVGKPDVAVPADWRRQLPAASTARVQLLPGVSVAEAKEEEARDESVIYACSSRMLTESEEWESEMSNIHREGKIMTFQIAFHCTSHHNRSAQNRRATLCFMGEVDGQTGLFHGRPVQEISDSVSHDAVRPIATYCRTTRTTGMELDASAEMIGGCWRVTLRPQGGHLFLNQRENPTDAIMSHSLILVPSLNGCRMLALDEMAANEIATTASADFDCKGAHGCGMYCSDDNRLRVWVGGSDSLRVEFEEDYTGNPARLQLSSILHCLIGEDEARSPVFGPITTTPSNIGLATSLSIELPFPNLINGGTVGKVQSLAGHLRVSLTTDSRETAQISTDSTAHVMTSSAQMATLLLGAVHRLILAERVAGTPLWLTASVKNIAHVGRIYDPLSEQQRPHGEQNASSQPGVTVGCHRQATSVEDIEAKAEFSNQMRDLRGQLGKFADQEDNRQDRTVEQEDNRTRAKVLRELERAERGSDWTVQYTQNVVSHVGEARTLAEAQTLAVGDEIEVLVDKTLDLSADKAGSLWARGNRGSTRAASVAAAGLASWVAGTVTCVTPWQASGAMIASVVLPDTLAKVRIRNKPTALMRCTAKPSSHGLTVCALWLSVCGRLEVVSGCLDQPPAATAEVQEQIRAGGFQAVSHGRRRSYRRWSPGTSTRACAPVS